LVCDDDDAAIAAAKQLVDGRDVELWQGARKITTPNQKTAETNQSVICSSYRELGTDRRNV
jgi:hypothetical protein